MPNKIQFRLPTRWNGFDLVGVTSITTCRVMKPEHVYISWESLALEIVFVSPWSSQVGDSE